MRRADLRRVAFVLRELAATIDARGEHAWDLTREWSAGPRASTLEAARSRTLGDPTARAALSHDPDPHTAMLGAYGRLLGAVDALERLHRDAGPDRRPACVWHAVLGYRVTARRHVDGDRVCDWCYRRHGHLHRQPTPGEIHARQTGAARVRRAL